MLRAFVQEQVLLRTDDGEFVYDGVFVLRPAVAVRPAVLTGLAAACTGCVPAGRLRAVGLRPLPVGVVTIYGSLVVCACPSTYPRTASMNASPRWA